MRALVQRVTQAEVRVGGQVVSAIGRGLLVFLGIGSDDTAAGGTCLAEKIGNLRVFENDAGRMERSILEVGGAVLVVSQFTLYGDCRKGRRPNYSRAASPAVARPLYEAFLGSMRELLRGSGVSLSEGRFQARMEVASVNEGPVTLILNSDNAF